MLPQTTRRLRFREMTDDDLDDLTRTLAGSQGADRKLRTRADAERWIEWNRLNYAEHGHGLWVIETHAGGFVGDCGLTIQSVEGEDLVEIGWHVQPDLRRQGYATEAAMAVRTATQENRIAEHLIAIIHPDNFPSRCVAENIGLRLERQVQYNGEVALVFGADLASGRSAPGR